MVPTVDIAALLDGADGACAEVDARIAAAAADIGFLSIVGLAPVVPLGPQARGELLGIFSLDPAARARLWRRKFAPDHPNIYRGYFPPQPGNVTLKEGIDLGPDVLHGARVTCSGDPLREATPLPEEAQLPGWRAAAARYYAAMERVSRALMQSVARGLRLEERFFDGAFREGLSTLRLLRYPARSCTELASCSDARVWVEHGGERRYLTGAAHTDSGFLTLLAQDGVPGLQARARDGSWVDVPPEEGALAVNFGQVLERWSGGRMRATEHRVIGSGAERYSIPFFYEARADAEIRPLPQDPAESFAPFLYGDYLWARMTDFVEFRGLERERQRTSAASRPPEATGRGRQGGQ